MRSITELKGLRDIRTTISTHARSSSRHKGTPYLEILSLGMEKLRLEAEMARLGRDQRRIEKRLGEIGQVLGNRLGQIEGSIPAVTNLPAESAHQKQRLSSDGEPVNHSWNTMTVEY